jgi:hypothetical protein
MVPILDDFSKPHISIFYRIRGLHDCAYSGRLSEESDSLVPVGRYLAATVEIFFPRAFAKASSSAWVASSVAAL